MTAPTAAPVRHVEHVMGTVFTLDVREPGVPAAAVAEVVTWLHAVDATFSTYRADSEVSRLGRAELALDSCSDDVRAVLARCAQLSDETGGYFSARPGGGLDPSGYVKGWAIERASDLLRAAGSRNHSVNGGGDVQCIGSPEPGRPWRIGIAHPLRPGALSAVVAGAPGQDLAVATSGTAERGAHVLDPHTGRPPQGLASVTVVGRRAADVDAYATAAFAMGLGALVWLAGRTDLHSRVVLADGRSWSSPGFAGDGSAAG